MEAMDKLSAHLRTRLVDLIKAKTEGRKIIGYTPGGFLPEELVIASGAIPVGLIRGGDHAMVELSSAYICRWIDTFCRGQIGYAVSGEDPYYNVIYLLVVPMTDNHIRAIMDVVDYNTNIDVFPFGVPHMKDNLSIDYYSKGIARLKKKLEELTGIEITEPKLREAIDRVLLTGSTLALGDGKVLDLTEGAGGVIVVEEFAEGIRPYWENVNPNGDLMAALVDGHFTRRVPPAWFRPGRERLDFLVKLSKDFNVDGVIWYQLMYRESYKTESYYFPDILKRETGLSMLTLESDYDAAEVGQLRTRIETFIESIGR